MLLAAAPVLRVSRDTEVRYRPDSELHYLTGLREPGVVAVLRPGADEPFVLFVRKRDPEAEQWAGARLGPEAAAEASGADAAHPLDELEERLPDLLAPVRTVHFRLGSDARVQALLLRSLGDARTKGSRKGTHPRTVVDPGEVLDELRLRKGAEEVERIRRAAGITVAGFRDAWAEIRPGAGEWEVEAALLSGFRRRGGDGAAFPPIVGSGANACVLHYEENRRRIEEGDLVLIDAGAAVDLYAGDVTRTVPASGRFTEEQRAVYDVVRDALRIGIETAAPGTEVGEVHERVRRRLTEGLVELGVLDGDVDDLVEEEAYKLYFPHQTSHWLGMDVHDPADYGREGKSRVLEPGMVLTVEPGLYFPPVEAGDAGNGGPDWEDDPAGRYRCIGVRLEDDVLVTEDGPESLTGSLPVDADEVAGLVGGGTEE